MPPQPYLRGLAAGWSAKLAAALVGLFLTPLLVGKLGGHEFGVYVLLTGLMPWLATLDLGLVPALRVILAREMGGPGGYANGWIATAWFGQCAFVLALAGLGWVIVNTLPLWFPINDESHLQFARLILAAFLVTKLGQVFGAVLLANGRVDAEQSARLTQTMIRTAILSTVAVLGGGLPALGYAWLAAAILYVCSLAYASRRYLPASALSWGQVRSSKSRELAAKGIWLSLGAVAGLLIAGADRAVIARFLSLEAVTRFSVTASLYVLAEALIQHVVDTARPTLARQAGSGQDDKVLSIYRRLRIVSGTLGLSAAAGLLALNRTFVSIWVGEELYGGRLLDLVLAANLALQVTIAPTRAVLAAALVVRPQTLARISEGALNLALSVALVPLLGLAGVALGTTIAALATNSWYLPRLVRRAYCRSQPDFAMSTSKLQLMPSAKP